MALAYHKMEGATPHPGVCKHSLQYDGRPDERIGVLVGTWNLGNLRGKLGEDCEELRKRMIDVCCLQEVRWRRQGARMLGMKVRRYKLWWSGKGYGGMRVMMNEELCEKVVEVRRVCDRVMTLVIAEDVLRLICGYAPQSVRSFEEKQSYDKLKCEWDMQSADDLVMCLGDFNGHVGRHINGFDGLHRGYCVGHRNLEGRMLLEFCLENKLCVSNTWFKREEERKVTFRMGENETEIDFVLIKKEH